MQKKENEVKTEKKTKNHIDKKKFIQGIIVMIMVVALLLSVAASLIYNLIYNLNQ